MLRQPPHSPQLSASTRVGLASHWDRTQRGISKRKRVYFFMPCAWLSANPNVANACYRPTRTHAIGIPLATPKAASRTVPNPGAVSSADHPPVDIDIYIDISVSVDVNVSIRVSIYVSICVSICVSVYVSVCVAIVAYVAITISIRESRQGLLARRTSDGGGIWQRRHGGLPTNRGERHKKKSRHPK